MFDIAGEVLTELGEGRAVAVSTVVSLRGSGPRPAGAAMAFTADGRAIGSISGGCIESDLYDIARDVLTTGAPDVQDFGIGDDDALRAGLACGGELTVFTTILRPDDAAMRDELSRAASGAGAAFALITAGPENLRGRAISPVGSPHGGRRPGFGSDGSSGVSR